MKLFAEGKALQKNPLRIVYLIDSKAHSHQPVLKAGFTVGTRNFKKAVDRNRIKRIMREVYRTCRQSLEISLTQQDKKMELFLIYTGKQLPEFQEVKSSFLLLAEKLITQCSHPQRPD